MISGWSGWGPAVTTWGRGGAGAKGFAPQSVLVLDISALTPGAPAGGFALRTTRGSDGGYNTSTGFVPSVGGSNIGRLSYTSSGTVLLTEPSATNRLSHPDTPWDATFWTGAPSSGNTVQDNTVQGPDGATPTAHITASSGGFCRYYSSSTLFSASSVQHTASVWLKPDGNSSYQINLADSANHAVGGTLPAGWSRQQITITPTTTSGAWIMADGRSIAVAAGARDNSAKFPQVEATPYATTYVNGTRAAETHDDQGATAASLAGDGSLDLVVTWIPSISSTAAASLTALSTQRIAGSDANTCVEVDAAKMAIRVIVDGTRTLLPTSVPAWSAGDVLILTLKKFGNGTPSGTISANGGAATNLGTGSALPPLRLTDSVPLYVAAASDGTLPLFGGLRYLSITVTKRATPRTFIASPTGGSGSAGTLADPASLDRALTLARAFLPAAPGVVRILLRGGTYYRTTTIALTQADSGLEICNYPGEAPVISGGELVTGAWTGPDGSGVYSKSFTPTNSSTFRQLYVAGSRAIRARSAVQTGWTKTSGGWTASSSAVAGLTHPEDTEIVGTASGGDWKMYRGRVASASGTAITMRTTDWNQAQDAPGSQVWDTVWWYEHWSLCGNNAGSFGFDAHTNTLYYKPRVGETMGSVEVVAATLDGPLLTITGALGSTAQNIRIRGITWQHNAWNEPETQGYAPLQDGIIGSGQTASANLHHVPAAVKLYAATSCTLSGCTIQHTGAGGIWIAYGSTDNIVSGCTLSDIGAGGVAVGDASAATDYAPVDSRARVSRNTVTGCSISSIGAEYWSSVAVWAGFVDAFTLSANTIDTCPYSGISVGWGWGVLLPSPSAVLSANTISGNKVTNWMKVDSATGKSMGDGGGIYLNGPQSGTVVSGNYVVVASSAGGSPFGLYADNATSGCSLTGNAVGTNSGGAWAKIQPASIAATSNTLTGNYYSATSSGISGTPDPSNTVGSNTADLTVAGALAIIAAAGRP